MWRAGLYGKHVIRMAAHTTACLKLLSALCFLAFWRFVLCAVCVFGTGAAYMATTFGAQAHECATNKRDWAPCDKHRTGHFDMTPREHFVLVKVECHQNIH